MGTPTRRIGLPHPLPRTVPLRRSTLVPPVHRRNLVHPMASLSYNDRSGIDQIEIGRSQVELSGTLGDGLFLRDTAGAQSSREIFSRRAEMVAYVRGSVESFRRVGRSVAVDTARIVASLEDRRWRTTAGVSGGPDCVGEFELLKLVDSSSRHPVPGRRLPLQVLRPPPYGLGVRRGLHAPRRGRRGNTHLSRLPRRPSDRRRPLRRPRPPTERPRREESTLEESGHERFVRSIPPHQHVRCVRDRERTEGRIDRSVDRRHRQGGVEGVRVQGQAR
mmetsp:Transcript_13765/g.40252  ORF Transcript_13765/g.40252 Transcript_13765/m.40252 type:complete len:276 (+) Transcript_13765:264-1091(+)